MLNADDNSLVASDSERNSNRSACLGKGGNRYDFASLGVVKHRCTGSGDRDVSSSRTTREGYASCIII